MVSLNSETLCLSEATEVIYEISFNFTSKFIVQVKNISIFSVSFDKNFEHLSMKSIFEAKIFKPETKFETTFYDIKDNHLKRITSFDMILSSITLNKPHFIFNI